MTSCKRIRVGLWRDYITQLALKYGIPKSNVWRMQGKKQLQKSMDEGRIINFLIFKKGCQKTLRSIIKLVFIGSVGRVLVNRSQQHWFDLNIKHRLFRNLHRILEQTFLEKLSSERLQHLFKFLFSFSGAVIVCQMRFPVKGYYCVTVKVKFLQRWIRRNKSKARNG